MGNTKARTGEMECVLGAGGLSIQVKGVGIRSFIGDRMDGVGWPNGLERGIREFILVVHQ